MLDLNLLGISTAISEMKILGVGAFGGSVLTLGTALRTLQEGVLSPTETFIPIGVVVGLFLGTITLTVKLVRLFDKLERRHEKIEERLTVIEENLK